MREGAVVMAQCSNMRDFHPVLGSESGAGELPDWLAAAAQGTGAQPPGRGNGRQKRRISGASPPCLSSGGEREGS